jgi:hypothetical protein
MEPDFLREHASEVKRTANRKFWNPETGRFFASINKEGKAYDYGFVIINLEAIWYGIASDEHARSILDWITGKRIVEGDTSTGEDIYKWRFAPRSTTLRNLEWYGQGWITPEVIPWGGQVQDGGAVLGFTFYDLWARLKYLGADNAWQRLTEILDWEQEVMEEGGYREYYKDGKHGTTLQGGGTAGGLGIDWEFFESSLPPAIVVYGFLGLDPEGDALLIAPELPSACPEMGLSDFLYRGVPMDIRASQSEITLQLKENPLQPVVISLDGRWTLEHSGQCGNSFYLPSAGTYKWTKQTD